MCKFNVIRYERCRHIVADPQKRCRRQCPVPGKGTRPDLTRPGKCRGCEKGTAPVDDYELQYGYDQREWELESRLEALKQEEMEISSQASRATSQFSRLSAKDWDDRSTVTSGTNRSRTSHATRRTSSSTPISTSSRLCEEVAPSDSVSQIRSEASCARGRETSRSDYDRGPTSHSSFSNSTRRHSSSRPSMLRSDCTKRSKTYMSSNASTCRNNSRHSSTSRNCLPGSCQGTDWEDDSSTLFSRSHGSTTAVSMSDKRKLPTSEEYVQSNPLSNSNGTFGWIERRGNTDLMVRIPNTIYE